MISIMLKRAMNSALGIARLWCTIYAWRSWAIVCTALKVIIWCDWACYKTSITIWCDMIATMAASNCMPKKWSRIGDELSMSTQWRFVITTVAMDSIRCDRLAVARIHWRPMMVIRLPIRHDCTKHANPFNDYLSAGKWCTIAHSFIFLVLCIILLRKLRWNL